MPANEMKKKINLERFSRRCALRNDDFKVPSPLMGEGEVEGENPRFVMPWQVAILIGRNKSNPYIFLILL